MAIGTDFEYRTCHNEFDFVLCSKCHLTYLNPRPTIEALPSTYPSSYKPFHFNKTDSKYNLILAIRNILESRKAAKYRSLLPSKARILDVGCGDGRYLSLMKKVSQGEWIMEGVDFNEEAVKRAREFGIKAVAGSYEDTAFDKKSYDLILMNQVIEHFPDPGPAVEKAWRELKPGGIISIETPSLDGIDAHIFRKRFWGGYHFPRHLTLFSEVSINLFLKNRKFEVLSVNYMLSPVFWVFSWHHWWEARVGKGAGFFSDSNPLVLGIATFLDIIQRLLLRKTSNMQVIARKVA